MAVKLEGAVKRYIGLSTDEKPRPFVRGGNMPEGETLPPGSSFLETDTGRIYRFDGDNTWSHALSGDAVEVYLAAILAELTALRETVTLAVSA